MAAINKIKSQRKDLIKENDIRGSIKSRENANIHFFFYSFSGGGVKRLTMHQVPCSIFHGASLQRAGVWKVYLCTSDHGKGLAEDGDGESEGYGPSRVTMEKQEQTQWLVGCCEI